VNTRKREDSLCMCQSLEVSLRTLGDINKPIQGAWLEKCPFKLLSLGYSVQTFLDVRPEDLTCSAKVALASPVAWDEAADNGMQPAGEGP